MTECKGRIRDEAYEVERVLARVSKPVIIVIGDKKVVRR
jgi:hypothetical protein